MTWIKVVEPLLSTVSEGIGWVERWDYSQWTCGVGRKLQPVCLQTLKFLSCISKHSLAVLIDEVCGLCYLCLLWQILLYGCMIWKWTSRGRGRKTNNKDRKEGVVERSQTNRRVNFQQKESCLFFCNRRECVQVDCEWIYDKKYEVRTLFLGSVSW